MLDWLRNKLAKTSFDNCNAKATDDGSEDMDDLNAFMNNKDDKVNRLPLILGTNNNNKKKGGKNAQKPIIVLPACCGAPCGYPLGNCGTGLNHPFLQAPSRGNFNPLHCLAQCCCNNSNGLGPYPYDFPLDHFPDHQPPFCDYPPNYPHYPQTYPSPFPLPYPQSYPHSFPQNYSNAYPQAYTQPCAPSYFKDKNFCSHNMAEHAYNSADVKEKQTVVSSMEKMFSKLLSMKRKLTGFEDEKMPRG